MNKCIFKLNDICDISGGYAFKSTIFKDNGIPIIRIGENHILLLQTLFLYTY